MQKKHVWCLAIVVAIIVCNVVASVLLLQPSGDENTDPPEVRVNEGVLQGEWLSVSDGVGERRFAAFRGIPYAAPPIGLLRFKAPRPPLPWTGRRDATRESADCWQQSPVAVDAVGSEDCLYLNVYTNNTSDQLQPVYFFVHGGGFLIGSGNHSEFGPEFLMLQNIVVVTIKYRLGPFGFLNLDNEIVPGNAGLKDQIAALQWVSRNIAKFGGDPSQITVGGQSAGAMTTHWLSLLPESRDLVKRVILESGSALNNMAYNEDNFEVAADLGRELMHKNVTLEELAQLLMSLPAKQITEASISMAHRRFETIATQIPYAMSPERRTPVHGGEKPLITHAPETFVINPNIALKPVLMGMSNKEFLVPFYMYGFDNITYMNFRIATLIDILPKNIIPYPDTIEYLGLTDRSPSFKWSDVISAVDSYFFHRSDPTCNLTCTFKQYTNDITFGLDTDRLVDLRVRRNTSTTHVYRFSMRAQYSTTPVVDPDQLAGSAVHTDELGYIWKMGGLTQTLNGDNLASRTLQRMTNMWGSFIRTGIPSPDGVFTWRPSEKRKSEIIFLEIKESLEEKEESLSGPSMPFWFNLYEQYRKKLSRRDYKSRTNKNPEQSTFRSPIILFVAHRSLSLCFVAVDTSVALLGAFEGRTVALSRVLPLLLKPPQLKNTSTQRKGSQPSAYSSNLPRLVSIGFDVSIVQESFACDRGCPPKYREPCLVAKPWRCLLNLQQPHSSSLTEQS